MSTTTDAGTTPQWRGHAVLLLCFFTIVFDGYDLVVYGSTMPSLLAYEPWGITPESAGWIGSLALVGMLLGTFSVSLLTDKLGRRRILIFAVAWFSVLMLLTGLAPNLVVFALLRFLTGLGLGCVVPTCIALTVEFAPKHRRQLANAVMFSGYSVGGVGAALLALAVLEQVGFRAMYFAGGLSLFTLLPAIIFLLPESVAHLASTGRTEKAQEVARRYGLVYKHIVERPDDVGIARASSIQQLFSKEWRFSIILFCLANFCGLLLVYGLNTWLPQIMRQAGFELGGALAFLLVLNVGAVVGGSSAAWLADKIGIQQVLRACFVLAVIAILLLSAQLPLALLLIVVAFAGLGSVGTQNLVGGFCSAHFPQHLTATALGVSLAFGRIGAITGPILGGYVAALDLGWQTNFYMFAAFGVIGALIVTLVPHRKKVIEREPAPVAS